MEIRRRIQEHALWLSLLIHALFLTTLVTFVRLPPPAASKPLPSSVSAYAAAMPLVAQAPQPKAVPANPLTRPPVAPKRDDQAIVLHPEKQAPEKPHPLAAKPVRFSRQSPPIDLTHPYDREPLQLVGEDKIVPPLVRILARAIGPHLFYPRVAAEFNLQGVVLVGFTLHPEGYVTGARIVKSSGAGVLDDAARQGVASVNTVGNVQEFVSQPEFLVIGIIFG